MSVCVNDGSFRPLYVGLFRGRSAAKIRFFRPLNLFERRTIAFRITRRRNKTTRPQLTAGIYNAVRARFIRFRYNVYSVKRRNLRRRRKVRNSRVIKLGRSVMYISRKNFLAFERRRYRTSWVKGAACQARNHLKPEVAEVKTEAEKIWRHVDAAIRLYYPL